MERIVENKLADLRRLCARHRVTRFHLIGSAAKGRFDPARSDLDFLVEFGDVPWGKLADEYFDLLDDLREMFGRSVDLIMASAVKNPYLKQDLEETKIELYAA